MAWKWLKPLLGTANIGMNYWTGDTIGTHLGVIAGADNPDDWGHIGGTAYAAAMPVTRSLGLAFDGGYGIGEAINEVTGADKHLADVLIEWDPLNKMKKSFWDQERLQDPEWVAARKRYLERQNSTDNTTSSELPITSKEVYRNEPQLSLWNRLQNNTRYLRRM